MTYPDANKLFSSPAREDGTQKWVDFVKTFWHLDCVCGINQTVFRDRYQKWCEKNKYNFSSDKSAQIYADAQNRIALMPKNHLTKRIVRQSVDSLIAVSRAVERLKTEMLKLSEQIPEYSVVMDMLGVGESLEPQLMAEIGDVMRFPHRSTITAFAGVDPGENQPGIYEAKSSRISKRGSPELRRTLFLVMSSLLRTSPQDDPAYQFMNKKRAQGKPYLVYMTAGANKFLRVYYGRVKEHLTSSKQPAENNDRLNF